MISILLGFALLASAIISNKIALQFIAPTFLVALRMLCAGVLLIGFAWRKSHRLHWGYLKQDAVTILTISFFTTLFPSLLKAYALKNMFSSKAAFLGSLDPFVTAMYAYVLWHEKLSFQKLVGIGVGFIGTMMVLFMISPNEQTLMAGSVFSYPELAALGAMAIGRLGWILVQKLLKKDRYSVPEINGVTMLVSGLGSLALAIYWQEVSLSQLSFSHYKLLVALAWTIIVGNVFGYSLYAHALRVHSATFVALTGFSVPIFVYLFGWLILGEPLSAYFMCATFVTFIGLLIFYHAEIVKGFAQKE